MRPRCLRLGLLGALALSSGPAFAQETREYELPDLEEPPGIADFIDARLAVASRFLGQTDFGSFDAIAYQPEGRLLVQVPLSRQSLIRLVARARAQLWDFDGVSNLFGTGPTTADPFDDLIGWTARIQAGHLLPESWTLFSDEERWGVLAQGEVRARYETGSDVSDGLRGGGGFALFYRLGKRLELAAGLNLRSRIERSGVSVQPFFELDWRITDVWRLKSYGIGLQLERTLGEDVRVFARARLESRRYRLDDRGGSIGKGDVRIRQLPVGLGVRWSATSFLRVRLIAGAITYNQLKIRNDDRNTLSTVTGDVAPYVTLRFDLKNP